MKKIVLSTMTATVVTVGIWAMTYYGNSTSFLPGIAALAAGLGFALVGYFGIAAFLVGTACVFADAALTACLEGFAGVGLVIIGIVLALLFLATTFVLHAAKRIGFKRRWVLASYGIEAVAVLVALQCASVGSSLAVAVVGAAAIGLLARTVRMCAQRTSQTS